MREAMAPDAAGQRLVVEDREGERWIVECRGEPVAVDSRIAFEPVAPLDGKRGEFVRLLEQTRLAWVCTVAAGRHGFELTPFGGVEAPEFSLTKKNAKDAAPGQRVVVVPAESESSKKSRKTSRRPRGSNRTKALPVRVVEVLGRLGEPDADHRALAWKHRLPGAFSRRARLETDGISPELDRTVLTKRVDLRHLPFVTIDPASARDHDDAVFAERSTAGPTLARKVLGEEDRPARSTNKGKWSTRLWVAIADVSHFVEEGGFVDAEARRRGNSFYFPDRSIPMLPERLSGDLCSLRPDVDRLAMVVELRLSAEGQAIDALFHEAVIRSRARLSYEEASSWLESDKGDASDLPDWGASLQCLVEVAAKLSKGRRDAGAIELFLPEIEVVTDETGRPMDARPRQRNRAHGLIEEAMLAANRAVAAALDRAERETIHRVHPPPSPQKLQALEVLLDRFAIEVDGELDEPGVMGRVLDRVKGASFEERIHMAALRSMSQARYEAESGGHYALRFPHYLHFTSPIRRYADLEVHRALRALIRGEPGKRIRTAGAEGKGEGAAASEAVRIAIWLSARERLATEAERDAEALAFCALMRDREGERFEAEITGATEFGLFIRLRSPAVTGLVPIRFLSGRWEVDTQDEALVAERSGARLAPGDEVHVRLVSVDADRGRLSFRLEPKRASKGSSEQA